MSSPYRGNGGVGKDRSAALELFEGGPRMVDRATAGKSVAVPNWSASLVGGIQPDKLRPLAPKLADDGLLQRFIIFDGFAAGRGDDRTPDAAAISGYESVIRRLLDVRPREPARAITLDWEAHIYRIEVEGLADAVAGLPTSVPALREHLAKWPGIFARLLLAFHAIECATDGRISEPWRHLEPIVSPGTAHRVRDLMVSYLLPCVVKFYDGFFRDVDVEGERVRDVASVILAHKLGKVTRRDLTRHSRDLTKNPSTIGRIMETLVTVHPRRSWLSAQEHGKHSLIPAGCAVFL